jgi:hypothetical protein
VTSNPSDPTNLPELKITCRSTDCANGLHCYIQKKKQAAGRAHGPCRECSANLVNWDRVHAQNLADVAHTFEALKTEYIRHHYWHVPLDEVAINHARRKGRAGMREAAINRLRQSVAPAHPYRDGMQTGKKGNALFYAQHATATCCRKCIEETDEELGYLTELVTLYVTERLPELTETGEFVPTRRQRLVSTEHRRRESYAQERLKPSRHIAGGSDCDPNELTRDGNSITPSAEQRLLAAARQKRLKDEA